MAKPRTKTTLSEPEGGDGRRARAQDSRRRIVEAMLELAREGDLAPSADSVAARAGVGRRTVFRLFADMESLYREMHAVMAQRIDYIRAMPIEGATWRARLDALIERRVRLFEEIMPVKVAGDVHRHRSAFLQAAHGEVSATLRQMLRFVLPKAITDDADRFEALDAALSIEVWARLRRDQGLTQKAAVRALKRMVDALVV
jgi:AcrR family transcriptional regulator